MIAGALAWTGAAGGGAWGGGGLGVAIAAGMIAVAGAGLIRVRRGTALLLGSILVAGCLSGWGAADRERATLAAAVPEGPALLAGRIAEDPRDSGAGVHFLLDPTHRRLGTDWVEWAGPRIVVDATDVGGVVAGDRAALSGTLRSVPGTVRGDPVAGRLTRAVVLAVDRADSPPFVIGNWLRRRITEQLAKRSGAPAGLLAGFLIGDVSGLSEHDGDDLRRAGLSHFVAVSGSNVALFLGVWWFILGPFGLGPKRRAALGLAGLVVFTIVTRWEPSVVRAATMAGLGLGGSAAGIPVDAWTALGGAVTILILASGQLVGDVGFQLSVAATAGVLAGAGVFAGRHPTWAWSALGVTMSAQIAVAPLLLAHFGTVPLLSPIANLLAAPLVAAATAAGGVGVFVGIDPLVGVGSGLAGGVLAIARTAAEWPQLGPAGTALLAGVGLLGLRPRLRPVVVMGCAVAALAMALPPGPPERAIVVFLDVGQGDAILLRGPGGETVLIDGGPEPAGLRAALRRHGVDHIDLLVLTHGHADHLSGIVGLTGHLPVGEIWHAPGPDPGDILPGLLVDAAARGIGAHAPEPGEAAVLGAFRIEVLGPQRRYASLNDGSLVLLVAGPGATLLLPGDIEAIAQRELGPLPTDVMKVPHQGAATSDLAWLEASVGAVAVITVGPNDYGHPSPEVVDLLENAGARVFRTDEDGDVVIPLG